jgi:MerR HTH family regulatory protein
MSEPVITATVPVPDGGPPVPLLIDGHALPVIVPVKVAALKRGWPRSDGGRRRYTRRQLALAARIRELFDQGHTLAAALRILALEDDLAAERALTASLRERLGRDQGQRGLG